MAESAMELVLVSLGSNIEPERNLLLAARALAEAFPRIRYSGVYRNGAVGFEGPDFYNAVAAFDTGLGPDEVVEHLHRVETLCGRPREARKWASRSMDLDLLMHGERIADEQAYRLPRPDLLRRAYMLGPAAEVAPHARHPLERRTLEALWADFGREHALERVPLELGSP